jgi:hypothetical protein
VDPDYIVTGLFLNGSPISVSLKLGGTRAVASFSMPAAQTSSLALQTQFVEPPPPPVVEPPPPIVDPPPPPPTGEWCLIGGGEIFPGGCPSGAIDPSAACSIGEFGIACETDSSGNTRVFEYECVEAGTCNPALVPPVSSPPVSSPPPSEPPPPSPPPSPPPPPPPGSGGGDPIIVDQEP